MVVTRNGAAAAAEWRERVISNVAPCPPQCAITNQDYYTQEDISKVEGGCSIRILNKATLEWRTGTVVRNASTDAALSHVKMIRFGAVETGVTKRVDLFRCFWNHCGPPAQDDLSPPFSLTLTEAQNERVDNMFADLPGMQLAAHMFPWSNTGPQIWALEALDAAEALYSDGLLGFFEQAVLESSSHPERKRVIALTPDAIPPDPHFEGIPENDTERRRKALRDYTGRLGLPSLVTIDLILVPVIKDDHIVLVVGDVNRRIVNIVDPVGVDETGITNTQRRALCQALDDMWARDLRNLGYGSSYFRLASRNEERRMFSDYDLPLQPVDDEGTDLNCVPLVFLYLATIASGRKFDYGQYGEYREALRQGMEPEDENWLTFAVSLRRKIASVLAQYGEYFRFMY